MRKDRRKRGEEGGGGSRGRKGRWKGGIGIRRLMVWGGDVDNRGWKKHKRANYICEVTCSYVRYSQTSQVIKTCMRRNDTYERMVPKSKSQRAVRRGGGGRS